MVQTITHYCYFLLKIQKVKGETIILPQVCKRNLIIEKDPLR